MNIPLLQAYLPIFCIILLGFVLRKAGFPGERFWPAAERMTYYILFPALLLLKIATVKTSGSNLLPLVAAVLCSFLSISLLLVAWQEWKGGNGPVFTSLFQGTIRFNTYIGLTIILFSIGESGMLAAAVIMATLIPMVNILCIIILLRYGSHTTGKKKLALFSSILKNPIVVACLVGIFFNIRQIHIITPAANLMAFLGKAALPLGLLCVGAGLSFNVFKSWGGTILISCCLKLLVLPILMVVYCRIFQVSGTAADVALLFAALPGSALSFILAKQLGGDSMVMSGIITGQTCLSILTMPIVMYLASILT